MLLNATRKTGNRFSLTASLSWNLSLHMLISYGIFMVLFGDVNTLRNTWRRWHTSMLTLSPVSELSVLLNKNMSQLKMIYHLDPRAGLCAGLRRAGSVISTKRLWNSNVLLHNNAMCNQWMPDNLGEKLHGQTGAGWIPAVHCQGSDCRRHTHTVEGEPKWP